MNSVSMAAFAHEVEKIAKVILMSSEVEGVKNNLQPGDVLATRPRKSGIGGTLLHAGLALFQGTPWTHVALYAGKGKVVNTGTWNGKTSTQIVPLEEFIDRYKFKILRVKASLAERLNAIKWAKSQVGKDFKYTGLVRLALPVASSKTMKRIRQENLSSLICSQLISNAYPNQNFGAHRAIQHVRPVDIQKSHLTKTVAEVT